MRHRHALPAALLLLAAAAAACAREGDAATSASAPPAPVLLGPYVPAVARQPSPRPLPPSPSPAPRGTRNPFVPPDPALVPEPAPPEQVAASPVRRAGRNPFVPLVGPSAPPAAARTEPEPAVASAPLLGPGTGGPAVRELQALLAGRGWRLAVDGVYGPRTTAVVAAFQRRRGLQVDGLAGPRTWAALRRRP